MRERPRLIVLVEAIAHMAWESGLNDLARDDWLLSAVSSRTSLAARVQHILDGPHRSPVSGLRWTAAAAFTIALAALGLALAQARPATSEMPTNDPAPLRLTGNADPRTSSSSTKEPSVTHLTINGRVAGLDGRPAANVTVYWYGFRKPLVSYASSPPILPKGSQTRSADREELLRKANTDAAGRFHFEASLDPGHYYDGTRVVALGKGAGLLSHAVRKGQSEVALKLAPEAMIRGTLIGPSGTPASGVRVSLMSIYGEAPEEVELVGLSENDGELPAYWPRSQTTNRDGRFTLGGVPASCFARLSFRHPDYAVDEVTVNARADRSTPEHMKWTGADTVGTSFTHALEPARPVQGRVTDRVTGKPLAGFFVEMTPRRGQPGGALGGLTFSTRTDADGRYRVSGHEARDYWTTVYPPPDSGCISIQDRRKWPAGARVLEVNFALPRGRLLEGRVIHAENKQPIAGAVVVYEPKRGNPNDLAGYNLNNPTLTDDRGHFAVTGIAGDGFVLVEAPMLDGIRVKLVPGKSEKYGMFPHGFVEVNVAKTGEIKALEIPVRKGVKLEARLVAPDGKPVSGFAAYCPGLSGQLNRPYHGGVDYPGDTFFVNGADPDRTYRVMFTAGERGVGTITSLKWDPNSRKPIEVKLQRLARVHGKVVGPSGSTVTSGQIYAQMVVTENPGPFDRDQLFSNAEIYTNLLPGQIRGGLFDRGAPNAQGEFVLDMLMPGARLYLTATMGNRSATVPIPSLHPGDNFEMGTITLNPEPR